VGLSVAGKHDLYGVTSQRRGAIGTLGRADEKVWMYDVKVTPGDEPRPSSPTPCSIDCTGPTRMPGAAVVVAEDDRIREVVPEREGRPAPGAR